jgi:hypothetical protein
MDAVCSCRALILRQAILSFGSQGVRQSAARYSSLSLRLPSAYTPSESSSTQVPCRIGDTGQVFQCRRVCGAPKNWERRRKTVQDVVSYGASRSLRRSVEELAKPPEKPAARWRLQQAVLYLCTHRQEREAFLSGAAMGVRLPLGARPPC